MSMKEYSGKPDSRVCNSSFDSTSKIEKFEYLPTTRDEYHDVTERFTRAR
jgi:hypothetical protein